MTWRLSVLPLAFSALVLPVALAKQATQYALTSVAGLRLHNVSAEPATLEGRQG